MYFSWFTQFHFLLVLCSKYEQFAAIAQFIIRLDYYFMFSYFCDIFEES